ncbi:hypothetical protein C2S53_019903 [Perilla frutescens var. hirtella]|uniref:Uncharacterized protein n=1 Tax=Perilla frutescens var. hirtella TaxID=608512 RepID=A0AAD4P402_PERFH|nr:hypothetical protein C2S53_019903 [Perilla frutescens var. hirtella]
MELEQRLRFTLIPLMLPGHIIPMIDMAKLLAQRGVSVTIIVTPLNATRFGSSIHRAAAAGLSIRLLPVSFPAEEAGLPPGCESVDMAPSYKLIRNFYIAITLWQQPVEQILAEMEPSSSCIICDKHIAWASETSIKLQIPQIIFDGTSCFTQLITHKLRASKIHESAAPTQPFVVPDLPDRIEFAKLQLSTSFNQGSVDVTDLREQVREAESQAYGVVVNSFRDLEKSYADEFHKVKGGKVWSIGPLSLCRDDDLDRNQTSDDLTQVFVKCLRWLDDRDPGCVIYVCLGSLSRLSTDQFVELPLGLESSSHPFILVVKEGSISTEIEKWISDEEFEERTRETGLVVRGWVPQVLILSHPSFLNEKLVVQILETGVGVGARAVVHLGEEVKPENRVTRDGIRSGIERVMDSGKEGEERRRWARELQEMAKMSVQVGGSSYANLTLLIQEISRLGA